MNPLTIGILGLGTQQAGTAVLAQDVTRDTPHPISSGKALPALKEAYNTLATKKGITDEGRPRYLPAKAALHSPRIENATDEQQALFENMRLGNLIDKDARTIDEVVVFNPNGDRAILAHEMGHSLGSKTKIGGAARRAQQYLRANPNLAKAIGFSALISAGVAPAMIPGDDDALISAGIMAAASAPQLIDEFNATREGLGILKGADMRASLGQRGKLAGAYLTYAGIPVINGAIMAALGNNFDENI